jgi:putative glutamine amidotransferase
MHKRPVIGIPTQTLEAIPDELPRCWLMSQRYVHMLVSVGAVPWIVPLLDDEATLRRIYDQVDGVFLPGGVDMDPASYGEERHELCGRTDPPRDHVELAFTRWALEDGKPVFGVCRGMQVINVAAGGTLYQDCGEQVPGAIKHDYFPGAGWARDYLAHEIRLAPDTRLRRVFGADTVMVNSMHHQGIRTVGEGLVPSAHSPDGLLEALEGSGDAFLVGVQWHPEMLMDTDPGTLRLFEEFIEASRQFHESRALAAA